MYTDPIADYLTRIRNAASAGHRVVEIPASNLKKEMTKILFDQGYILSYKFIENKVQDTIKIALKYNKDKDNVPKVAAKGAGVVAEKIIDLARKHGIPMKDDPDLVEVLSKLEIEEEIPPEIYVVVAELLAYVYSLNKKGGF